MGTRTLITEAEFQRLPDDGNHHELDEGELIVMPPPRFRHGVVQSTVAAALHSAAKGQGFVLTESGYRLAPGTVRGPDVSFISEKRRPDVSWDGYCNFGPDLAVEILSPDDTARNLQRKIAQYLAAGTQIVWVLDPKSTTVTIYRRDAPFRTLGPDDVLDAPGVLPEFSVKVAALFE
jgi:Uma2 family endonuclease